ncbi:unnamed protein product [Cylindrotheca closterium]|uniref:Uncharacterized protein n=1 Tax=Cylindrotheca closterium TaxID=2856 RepID=A0AAD2FEP3_9STRA|nr:unnamed protein product [Cylindrotheca closterium]
MSDNDHSWYDYFQQHPPNNNNNEECDEPNVYVVAKAGVCLFEAWGQFIPYFDALTPSDMSNWPSVVALRGRNCVVASQTELDEWYADNNTDDVYPDDCRCEFCVEGKCTLHWGSTKKCLSTKEIQFPQAMDLDELRYGFGMSGLHEDGAKFAISKHEEFREGGLVEPPDDWYDYFQQQFPKSNECSKWHGFVVAKAGVCLYDDWESLIPYFDSLAPGMAKSPDVVALRGENCLFASQDEFDVIYGSKDEDFDVKDCYCVLCVEGKCVMHWGFTYKCLHTTELVEFPQVMDLDDPQYKYLAEYGTDVGHSPKHQEGHGSALIKGENSLSNASNLSSVTLFWLLVSIFTVVSLIVGLLSCETTRRLWNRRQRLARAAPYYRSSNGSFCCGCGGMMQDDDDDDDDDGNSSSELDPLSVELTPILNDRPICTPFHLRNK